jgi:hypothetical protein
MPWKHFILLSQYLHFVCSETVDGTNQLGKVRSGEVCKLEVFVTVYTWTGYSSRWKSSQIPWKAIFHSVLSHKMMAITWQDKKPDSLLSTMHHCWNELHWKDKQENRLNLKWNQNLWLIIIRLWLEWTKWISSLHPTCNVPLHKRV